jgi:hypothetical protein
VHCDYPIFAYHRICPMCSQPIEKIAALTDEHKAATTRFDFWFKNFKRTLSVRPRNAASLET